MPVHVTAPVRIPAPGAKVIGGTVNGTGAFTFRATGVGADTALSRIIRMVEDAQQSRPPIQGLADRVVNDFVPLVLAIALVTFLAWLLAGGETALTNALIHAVAVLIIACPCAMGLATPVSIMVGSGRAAQMGVLFRTGAALEGLGEAQVVAVDKTGTVTRGQPEVTDVVMAEGERQMAEGELLRLAAAAESSSEHPLARAIERAAAAFPSSITHLPSRLFPVTASAPRWTGKGWRSARRGSWLSWAFRWGNWARRPMNWRRGPERPCSWRWTACWPGCSA